MSVYLCLCNKHSCSSPLESHDVVVWAGDLNYRIQVDVPVATVLDKAKANDLAPLLLKDQLQLERFRQRVFVDYAEGV